MPTNDELVLGGISGLAQGLGAEAEKQRPMTQAERAIAELLTGANPRELAIKHKLEAAGHISAPDIGIGGRGAMGVAMSAPSPQVPPPSDPRARAEAAFNAPLAAPSMPAPGIAVTAPAMGDV